MMNFCRSLEKVVLGSVFVWLVSCTDDDKRHLCPSCTNTLYVHDHCFGDYSIGDSEKDF